MNHKQVQQNLLLYLEDSLAQKEMARVREHLKACPVCNEHFSALTNIWQAKEAGATPGVCSAGWLKLETRLKEYENNRYTYFWQDIKNGCRLFLQPTVVVLLLLLAVAIGYYQGDLLSGVAQLNQESVKKEAIAKTFHLDTLEPLPPETLGEVFTMASNNNGE